ncbi:MAG: AI-2E family transporter, partial [Candidatus Melainabacteria bacterium]|nr:AI-2E family transporter [Candidatus Melainabacteria bacterium]
LVVPAMVYQISQLIDSVFAKLPELLTTVTQALTPLESRLQAAQINVRAVDIVTGVISNIPKPEPGAVIGKISEMTMSTMAWVLYAISIFVVSFYFLLEGHSIKDAVIKLFPQRYHNALQLMASDVDDNLQAFFRGQVVLAILAGLVMLGVYVLFGVQYALLLSAFLAVWEVVPVIGPPIGFAPAIISVAIHGITFPANRIVQIIVLTLVFNVLQQLKDNVLAPRYIGNVIGLHPILIFVAIMIGARVDGMLGIIFSLPMACVVSVFPRHLPLHVTQTAPLAEPYSSGEPRET